VPDHLIATRHQSAHPFRRRIRGPDFRKIASRIQAGQRAGVNLVGLHMGMGDRFHLQGVGDHHTLHMGRQNPGHRHAVAGRLDHHLVRLLQLPAEPLQGRAGHLDPAFVPGQTILPDHHLSEGPVDIYADNASHVRLPCPLKTAGAAGDTTTTDSRSRRNRASRRGGQLLTRARSSSYGSACPHLRAPGASVPDGRTIYPEPTIADAILDRIVHNAHRIELKGDSMRRKDRTPDLTENQKSETMTS